MTDFLVKRFVKDYENVQDVGVRTQYGVLSGMVGICCNLILFAVKITIGLIANSISVMADAFNNLSDAASSIVGFVGVKMAEKPADEEHPFGHGRIEYIAAFIVAFLVIQVGFSLFKTSFGKIWNPEPMAFSWLPVVILCLSIGMKLWLGVFNRKLGKRINSKVMMATAADSMGDVAATSATVCSILIFGMFQINLDGLIGLVVSVMVMIAGINIAKDTLAPLIGEAIDPEIYRQITDFVEGYDGIVGSHDLIVHNYGPSRSMASIHAEVPCDVDVETSHAIIDKIERDAARQMNLLLVIHMDPVEVNNQKVEGYREIARAALEGVDSRLTMHDFRIVDSHDQISIIFDLVVPRGYSSQMKEKTREKVCGEICSRVENCRCIITVENSYLAGD